MKTASVCIKQGVHLRLLATLFLMIFSACINSPLPQITPTPVNIPFTDTTQPPVLQDHPSQGLPQNSVSTLSPIENSQLVDAFAMDVISEMLEMIDRDRVLTGLMQLTGEMPICQGNDCHTISNRLTGSEELDWVQAYIHEELSRLDYSIETFEWSNSKYNDQNIIARKTGILLPTEEICVVAHLDGIKTIWPRKFPGADDDASGVMDLLELARVLNKYSFNRTVVLFFSSGEEQSALGVKSYLSQLTSEELSSIKYVVNVDMIGYDANRDSIIELVHGGHSPSIELATFMGKTMNDHHLPLVPKFLVGCG